MRTSLIMTHFFSVLCSLSLMTAVACSKNDPGSGAVVNKGAAEPTPTTAQTQLPGQSNGTQTSKTLSQNSSASGDPTQGLPATNTSGSAQDQAQNPVVTHHPSVYPSAPGSLDAPQLSPLVQISDATNIRLADDQLFEKVMAKMDQKATTQKQKTRNKELAASIRAVESKVDSTSGDLSVLVTGRDNSQQNLGGNIASQYTDLDPADQNSTMTGSFTCEDKDGAITHMCQIAVVDLKTKKAEMMAVIRHTNATLVVNEDQNPAQPSDDYKRLKSIFEATAAGSKASSAIRTIIFNSSEIVHGETHVQISMLTNDNQVIGVAGGFKGEIKGLDFTEGNLSKNIRSDDLIDLLGPNDIKQELQSLVQGAQLIKMQGGSEFSLLIDVKGTEEGSLQTIYLKLTRDNPAILQDIK